MQLLKSDKVSTEQLLLASIIHLQAQIKRYQTCPTYGILTRAGLEDEWLTARLIPGLAIAFFDLDNLKHANTTLGYEEVDRRLFEVFSLARRGEIFGRFFSGDEFVLLAPMYEIEKPVARIMEALKERGLSATVAIAPHSGEESLAAATKTASQKVQELKSCNNRGVVYFCG